LRIVQSSQFNLIFIVRDQPPLSISMHNSFGWPGCGNKMHEFKESHEK